MQDTQVRIAEADNTAQYWPNLGSQQSSIVIGPVSPFTAVKCWADDGDRCRLFKNLEFRIQTMDGTLLRHVSLLPRQTILEVTKPEFGTALARFCAKNKYWRPKFGP